MNLPDVLKKCRRPNFYVVNIFLRQSFKNFISFSRVFFLHIFLFIFCFSGRKEMFRAVQKSQNSTPLQRLRSSECVLLFEETTIYSSSFRQRPRRQRRQQQRRGRRK
jgi:hypothetical protein